MRMYRNVEPYREVTPFQDRDELRALAYEFHETLVQMGGMPTRPVLEEPVGRAIYREELGFIEIFDEHGKRTCTLGLDMDPVDYHWGEEMSRFSDELDRWKEFQNYQQSNPQLKPLFTAFAFKDTDEPLKAILIRLNEWREFEVFHQNKVNNALMLRWRNQRALEKLFQEESTSGPAASNPDTQSRIRTWLEPLFRKQTALDDCQEQLTCIENQAFEMLSNVSASLEGVPLLLQQLERKMEEQTNAVSEELKILKARPSHPARPPSPSSPSVQRILHWKSETTRLLKEHREWKIFLRWRKDQPNADTPMSAEEPQSHGHNADLTLWFDYVTYQQVQLDKARIWVDCWRRKQRLTEQRVERMTRENVPMLGGSVETVEKEVERFQQEIPTAEARLRSAKQQFAELLSEQAHLASPEATQQWPNCQELPSSAPSSGGSGDRFRDQEQPNSGVSLTKAHRPLPTQDILGSVRPSSMSTQVGKKRAKMGNIEKEQLTAGSDAIISDPILLGDDIQMTNASKSSCPHESIEEGGRVETMDSPMGGDKDTLITDAGDSVTTSSPPGSEVDSRCRGNRTTRKLAPSLHQVPTSRKTRSAVKLNEAISRGVVKRKKPSKKAKTFTEQQNMTLLHAGSIDKTPRNSPAPQLRRSQRLHEKAAAPSFVSSPQPKSAQHSQSSRQKRPKSQHSPVEPSRSSRQTKPKVRPNALELPRSSRHKRLKMQAHHSACPNL